MLGGGGYLSGVGVRVSRGGKIGVAVMGTVGVYEGVKLDVGVALINGVGEDTGVNVARIGLGNGVRLGAGLVSPGAGKAVG